MFVEVRLSKHEWLEFNRVVDSPSLIRGTLLLEEVVLRSGEAVAENVVLSCSVFYLSMNHIEAESFPRSFGIQG